MNDINSDTINHLGDILADLMLIAKYGDTLEFDYDVLGDTSPKSFGCMRNRKVPE